jgi:hypothetical protein
MEKHQGEIVEHASGMPMTRIAKELGICRKELYTQVREQVTLHKKYTQLLESHTHFLSIFVNLDNYKELDSIKKDIATFIQEAVLDKET